MILKFAEVECSTGFHRIFIETVQIQNSMKKYVLKTFFFSFICTIGGCLVALCLFADINFLRIQTKCSNWFHRLTLSAIQSQYS